MNGFSFLISFAKKPILDVWKDSEFASEASSDLKHEVHLNFWLGFELTFLLIIFPKLFPNFLLNLIKIFSVRPIHVTLRPAYMLNN